jgi:hypothetical protein
MAGSLLGESHLGEGDGVSWWRGLTMSRQEARLSPAEVVALRFYTTFVYCFMNDPLRNDARFAAGQPCPLPVTTHHSVEGIKKLRALCVADERCDFMGNFPFARPPNSLECRDEEQDAGVSGMGSE